MEVGFGLDRGTGQCRMTELNRWILNEAGMNELDIASRLVAMFGLMCLE